MRGPISIVSRRFDGEDHHRPPHRHRPKGGSHSLYRRRGRNLRARPKGHRIWANADQSFASDVVRRAGVAFSEVYSDTASDIWTLSRLTIQQGPEGSLQAVKRFNRCYAQPGQRFHYASAETLVLGLVLAGATVRSR